MKADRRETACRKQPAKGERSESKSNDEEYPPPNMDLNALPDPRAAVLVRPAETGDIAAWLRLREALWPDAVNEQDIAHYFADSSPGVTFLAASDENCIVGFAEVSVRRDWVEGCTTSPVAYLEGLFVEPAFRRRGVARQLIAAVESWAKEEGLTELGSDTEIGNTTGEHVH